MNNSHNFDASLTDDGRYRLLVEAISDYAIYMLDPTGIVANWNAGAQRFKGYRPSEIIGRNFEIFYTDTDRAVGRPEINLRRAAEVGRFEDEGWRVRKDGSQFWAHVVIDRILDPDGNLVGFAKITRDLTERHQAQQELERAREALFQSQKIESIGQLTGGVAHDFNNLLMAIIGSLEIVQRRMNADPNISPFIDNALKGARRGAVLTQRMLAFARRQELKMGAVNLKTTVEGMSDLLERSLGPAILIRTEVPENLPAVRTDISQLEAAILNLVVNARDAMPDGGTVRITALHKASDRPGNYVVFSVADEGEGMDADTLAKATEPFFTTKGIGKGTGLGLSMVHGLAQQSGGYLELQSEPGSGTTASIWLPVTEAEADTAVAPPASRPMDGRQVLRVLAVDDDALVLMNTMAMLQELGHEVVEAHSGREALEALERQTVDLLITDQGMPKMTGAELAQKVQAAWPHIPILVATGYAELSDSAARDLPRLSKPFSQQDLAAAIASTLGAAALARPAVAVTAEPSVLAT
ncbi:histidine kinase [Devosia sp. Root413D1]|uniref:PAS domain-containing sensor histidine kinase n=1 Tax=Devosia sp. Root413D1 TaxID=1736531 RepID=UPI0006F1EC57|nr:PAS domain-containing sensor histidine kinase [Devosia sp. Root413D1]KQW77719.1 histidine kinase [Devosia sp. Root413D1]